NSPDGSWGPTSGPESVLYVKAWMQGAADAGGGGALQADFFSWGFSDAGQKRLEESRRASVLGATDAGTIYRYTAGSSQVEAVFDYGNTQVDGGNVFRTIGTFYKTTPVCGGGGADPLSRVVAVEGPCFVNDATATGCSGAAPLTQLSYYATGTMSSNAG